MPPRRRTFYLADATVLSNSKVRRLARQRPNEWLAAWGAFHILIGVATLNGSPRLTDDDVIDTLGDEYAHLADLLRDAGLLTRTGIDPATFKEWCPKPRPRYPSDYAGVKGDSAGATPDSGGVGGDTPESPTSSSSSTSTSKSASPSKDGTPLRSGNGKPREPAPRGALALTDETDLPPHLRVVVQS